MSVALASGALAGATAHGGTGLQPSAHASSSGQQVPQARGAACADRARGGFIGIGGGHSFNDPSGSDCILALQGSSGAGVLRHVFEWSSIETSPGQYDWAAYDTWMTAVAQKGMRVLPVLFNPPSFYAKTSSHGTHPPRDLAAFGRFAAAAVDRYGPRGAFWTAHPDVPKRPIRSWQIWNEPNLAVYWQPRPSARGYAKMLRVVGTAIKRRDGGAEIVTAGMPDSKLRGAIPFKRFVTGLYRAKAQRYFTTLAPNAYGVTAKAIIASTRNVRRLMNGFGHRRGRIWITEVGWGTGGPRHRFNLGSARQAREIGRLFTGLYRRRHGLKLRGIVYYGWQDKAPYGPAFKDQWGLHTGLFTLDGEPKPSFDVFKRIAPTLR